MIVDFIVQMPLKVKELRNRGDETARLMMSYAQEGLDPPSNLRRHFENLMKLVSRKMYPIFTSSSHNDQDGKKLILTNVIYC